MASTDIAGRTLSTTCGWCDSCPARAATTATAGAMTTAEFGLTAAAGRSLSTDEVEAVVATPARRWQRAFWARSSEDPLSLVPNPTTAMTWLRTGETTISTGTATDSAIGTTIAGPTINDTWTVFREHTKPTSRPDTTTGITTGPAS